MENGTTTLFLVKMSINGEGEGGGTPSTMALLTLENPDQMVMGFELTGHCEPLLQGLLSQRRVGQAETNSLRANLVGSSSTDILSWKLDEEGQPPIPSERGILKSALSPAWDTERRPGTGVPQSASWSLLMFLWCML